MLPPLVAKFAGGRCPANFTVVLFYGSGVGGFFALLQGVEEQDYAE